MTSIIQNAKIIKCSDPLYWYNSLIGQIVHIERETVDHYWAREGGNWNCLNILYKEDVEIIKDERNENAKD